MNPNIHREHLLLNSIGVINTPFIEKAVTPIQSIRSNSIGKVEVFPEYCDGLDGLEDFSHIILIYIFYMSSGYKLKVKPFLDNQLHGLFSTRYPNRPNPLGISIVKLLQRDAPTLIVEGVDVIDSTPLLDIKPYVPDFDIRSDVKTGWY